MMQTVVSETRKPTGINIVRNGNVFTCTWKCGDLNYNEGQIFKYRVNGKKWHSVTVSASARSAKFSVTLSLYKPTTKKALNTVEVSIQGRRSRYTQTWNKTDKNGVITTVRTLYVFLMSPPEIKTFTTKAPKDPTCSISDITGSISTQTSKFSWSTTNDAKSTIWFRDVQVQTMLITKCTSKKGDKLTWKSSQPGWAEYSKPASGNITVTESNLDTTATYTRWYRARVRTVKGYSDWAYKYHTFCAPLQTVQVKATATKTSAGGYSVNTTWNYSAPTERPVDSFAIQYVFAVPAAGMTLPTDVSRWTDAATAKPGTKRLAFSVDSQSGTDQVLFVRVNAIHDDYLKEGYPVVATGSFGTLDTPTGLTVSANSDTYRATIECTNASNVPDSFLEVQFIKGKTSLTVGIMTGSSITVQCPSWSTSESIGFRVRAVVGSYTATTRADGVTSYAVTADMTSVWVSDGGQVPVAPGNVTATAGENGSIIVTWNWAWSAAKSAEISWSVNKNAWESTEEPETFEINNTYESRRIINGLDTGVTWYVRVRLANGETYGPYSDIKSVSLATAPAIPVLSVSPGIITEDGTFTASWAYVTTDGTSQAGAELALVSGTTYNVIERVETAQSITLTPEWTTGTYGLSVRVTSGSGLKSEWSDIVYLNVAEPIAAAITAESLEDITITVDGESRTVKSLLAMPLTLTVTGAGAGGTTTVLIERADAYHIDRPDESTFHGHEGETILIYTQSGEDAITIDRDDLIGNLDDEASYNLIAIVQDTYGQTDSVTEYFEVHWAEQAIIPEASVVIDYDNLAAKLTPTAPTGATETAVCDIYRLSADKPVLVYEGASFGETYVDPFPTLGEQGGHRFVYRTQDGDYITEDGTFAWLDMDVTDGDWLDNETHVINFGEGSVRLRFDTNLSNSWDKDFTETKYLGGSVQGDWNPAVSRTSSLSANVLTSDLETIQALRRLATYPGICHVRTADGSSYAANVEVSESIQQDKAHKIAAYSLSITRVDPEDTDGMTLAEWEALHEVE